MNLRSLFMKKSLFFILSIFCISCSLNKKSLITEVQYSAEKDLYSCKYEGISRNFILCLSENCNKDTSLVIMLHGLGGSAASFKKETQMEKTANLRNYAVVYVEGIVDPKNKSHGKGWHFYQDDFSEKDINFLMELTKYCQKEYGLGSKAFAVGFSNGGFMVNKLATVKKSAFLGVASVGGMMPKEVWDVKKAKKPMGYLQVNGTMDDVVPMEFNGSHKHNRNPSMEKVIEYYCKVNNISKNYKSVQLSDLATMSDYNSKVAWVIIREGRHNWPKKEYSHIEINNVILDYFDAFVN